MDDQKPKVGHPGKPYAKRRPPAKKPRPRKPICETSLVPISSYIRTVPDAVHSLLDIADRTEAHWRKMDAVAMHFAELALSLSSEIDKSSEALFCAEKALALREKYEDMRERIEQTASNVGHVLEWSRISEVCKRPPVLAPVPDTKIASA